MTYQKGLIIRKLIHLSMGLMILMLSYVVEKSVLLYLILAGSIFSFLTFNHKKFHILHKSADDKMDIELLSRLQFAFTIEFHYIHRKGCFR